MKNMKSQTPQENFHPQDKKQTNRPEVRDNLDSRKNEEQDFKGDDTTHNKKEVHSHPKKP